MTTQRRAISADQKQVRRQAILDIAWQLFQTTPYAEIAMTMVAEQAGLAKGTLYLYFKTKEELFLAVQAQQFESWFADLDARFVAARGANNIALVAEQIAGSLADRPAMTRLLAILHSVLEQNIDFSTALEFKTLLHTHILYSGSLLETCLDFLQAGDGVQVLMQGYVLLIGLQHVADPSPIAQQVISAAGFGIFVVDLAPEFVRALRQLLEGWRVLRL